MFLAYNANKEMKLPVSVIVITYNEESKIDDCLKSVSGYFQDIFIVDSSSTDRTVELAKKYTDRVYQHEFENYGKKRNWAINNLPIQTEWILNLDADHRVTESLIRELLVFFSEGKDKNYNGLLFIRKTIFLGREIRHGGCYPTYYPFMCKKGYGKFEEFMYDQGCLINGEVKVIPYEVQDIVTCNLSDFTYRHNNWSTLEAIDQLSGRELNPNRKIEIKNIFKNPTKGRHFLRTLYMKAPLFIRVFLYFFYSYFIRMGFLDGREGLIFYVLRNIWWRFLVDAKIYEIKLKMSKENKSLSQAVKELYFINI